MAFPRPRPEPRFALILSLIVMVGVELEIGNAKRLQRHQLSDVLLNSVSNEERFQSEAAATTQVAYHPLYDPHSLLQVEEQSAADAVAEAAEKHREGVSKTLPSMVTPPRKSAVEQLQEAAQVATQRAMAVAQDLIKKLQDNPELIKKLEELQEKAQQAVKQAQVTAEKASANIQDADMQREAKEAAQDAIHQRKLLRNAIDQARVAVQRRAAAALGFTNKLKDDPELTRNLQEATRKAMENAQALAQQAANAASISKLEKSMTEAAEKAKEFAGKTKEAVTDHPEFPQKVVEAAKKLAQLLKNLAISVCCFGCERPPT